MKIRFPTEPYNAVAAQSSTENTKSQPTLGVASVDRSDLKCTTLFDASNQQCAAYAYVTSCLQSSWNVESWGS